MHSYYVMILGKIGNVIRIELGGNSTSSSPSQPAFDKPSEEVRVRNVIFIAFVFRRIQASDLLETFSLSVPCSKIILMLSCVSIIPTASNNR